MAAEYVTFLFISYDLQCLSASNVDFKICSLWREIRVKLFWDTAFETPSFILHFNFCLETLYCKGNCIWSAFVFNKKLLNAVSFVKYYVRLKRKGKLNENVGKKSNLQRHLSSNLRIPCSWCPDCHDVHIMHNVPSACGSQDQTCR